jgi:hypothetical protein
MKQAFLAMLPILFGAAADADVAQAGYAAVVL